MSASHDIGVEPIGRNPRDAASYLRQKFGLGTTDGTLARWRLDVAKGKPNVGPTYHRAGAKLIFYLTEDLDRWAMGAPEQVYRARGGISASAATPPPAKPQPTAKPTPLRRRATRGR